MHSFKLLVAYSCRSKSQPAGVCVCVLGLMGDAASHLLLWLHNHTGFACHKTGVHRRHVNMFYGLKNELHKMINAEMHHH